MSKDKLFIGIALTMAAMAFAGASLMLGWSPNKTTLVVAGTAVTVMVAIQLRRNLVRRRNAAKQPRVVTTRQSVTVIVDRDLMIDTNTATNTDPTGRIDHFNYDPTARELVLR